VLQQGVEVEEAEDQTYASEETVAIFAKGWILGSTLVLLRKDVAWDE